MPFRDTIKFAVVVVYVFISMFTSYSYAQNIPLRSFFDFARDIKSQWIDGPGKHFVFMAYLEDRNYGTPDLNARGRSNLCGQPIQLLRGKKPKQRNMDMRWREIADQRLHLYDYYEPKEAVQRVPVSGRMVSAIWSENCMVARFTLYEPGMYAPHYEEVFAYYMLNYHDRVWKLRTRPNAKIVAYSTKPPCDNADSRSKSIRECTKLVDAIGERVSPFDSIKNPSPFRSNFLYFSEMSETPGLAFGKMDWYARSATLVQIPRRDQKKTIGQF